MEENADNLLASPGKCMWWIQFYSLVASCFFFFFFFHQCKPVSFGALIMTIRYGDSGCNRWSRTQPGRHRPRSGGSHSAVARGCTRWPCSRTAGATMCGGRSCAGRAWMTRAGSSGTWRRTSTSRAPSWACPSRSRRCCPVRARRAPAASCAVPPSLPDLSDQAAACLAAACLVAASLAAACLLALVP